MPKTSYSWWWGFLILWALVFFGRVAFSEPLTDVQRVDKAIVYILSEGITKHRVKPYPQHILLKNPVQRRGLAEAVVRAGKEHRASYWILIATAFREGSFKGKKEGLGGEKSVFQIMPSTMRRVRRFEPRCSFATVDSSALCAAALLRRDYDRCGSASGAIANYVTGKGCTPKTARVRWIVRDRLGIAKILKKKFEEALRVASFERDVTGISKINLPQ